MFYLPIGETGSKEDDEKFSGVASIHVQGKQTAIFAADCTH
jgi:hypothetical protein